MLQIIQDTREQYPFSFEGYPVEVKPGTLPTGGRRGFDILHDRRAGPLPAGTGTAPGI